MAAEAGDRGDIRKLPRMVRWYSPRHLVNTGWRSVVSELFGQYADQRVMQATIDGFGPEVMKTVIGRYNYADPDQLSDGNAVWVDYIADLGDGFDSTYAMASLISAPHLDIDGAGSLPAGKLLVMGGDQVYPYPTRKEYRERFEFPYQTALPGKSDGGWRRLLFVLPGNHDWYDGLNSFDHVFCKARFGHDRQNQIGGWLCPQHRSYFAIRLPHNWWIWGADIQLAQYLDAGQVLYFESVAQAMREDPTEVPKVILCTAEPSWNKEAPETQQGEDNLGQIAQIATNANARICAVLAGDYHHYNRYVAKETGTNFFTAGGGGAYLSPTHPLKNARRISWQGKTTELSLRCKIEDGKATTRPACWPSRSSSRLIGLRSLTFPIRNYGFACGLGIFYWLMTWLYATTDIKGFGGAPDVNVGSLLIASGGVDLVRTILLTLQAAVHNVMLGILSLALWIVLYVYADARYGRRVKVLLASAHWLAHVATMVVLYVILTRISIWLVGTALPKAEERMPALQAFDISEATRQAIRTIAIMPLEMVFIGGFVAALVWAIYLTVCSLFGLHSDQAFASMAIPDFKNFLRLKIEPSKLTIYPVGLRRTPRRHAWRFAKREGATAAAGGPQIVPARPLRPTLIEGPIEINVGDVKRPDPPAVV